jgi:hypothetical protein
MKRKLLQSISYLAFLLLLSVSCNKDKDQDNNNPTGPFVTHVTDGFLATTGIGRTGTKDTLVYTHNSATVEEFQGYQKGAHSANEEVRLNVHGNGVFSVERKKPYTTGGNSYPFFACSEKLGSSAGFPGYDYQYTLKKDYVPEAEFNIVWEGDKFSIESRLHPGHYFCPAKWANAVHPTQSCLVFGTSKHLFFFLKN